jgi:hypothetical protein
LKVQKRIVFILILLSVFYFGVFCIPNRVASKNLQMVTVFSPDEAVPLSSVFAMIKPANSIKEALINFAFYGYYFYGYPHFAYSALVVLPIKLLNLLDDLPLVMVTLRQMVSVLPMLAAVFVLVYLQTKFKSYKALVIFVFLLSIPGLVQNNLWWHPDSLAILFAMLTIFFLYRDKLRFRYNFYVAAAMCGFSAGTKGIGFYFVLTIPVYLLVGWLAKKAPFLKVVLSGLGYVLAMGLAYLVSNPLLIYPGIRQKYFEVLRAQFKVLTTGYGVVYKVGLISSWPSILENYGHWVFLLATLGVCILGVIRGPNRLLQTIILTWAIPLSILVFGVISFKYQYWLPAILPMFSTLTVILPDKIDVRGMFAKKQKNSLLWRLVGGLILSVVAVQFVFFVYSDAVRFNQRVHAVENNPAILFSIKLSQP